MTALAIFLIGIPAMMGISYACAWCTATWIARTCDCDFCSQTEDLP